MFKKVTFTFFIIMTILPLFITGGMVNADITSTLDIVILGSAEFTPGNTGIIQVSIQNNNTFDEVDASALELGLFNYYGAALGLTVQMQKDNAPITIKTEKALLGTLAIGEATAPVPFTIEVDEDATPGAYQVNVTLTYRTLEKAESKSGGGVDLDWADKIQGKTLDIKIKEVGPPEFEITNTEVNKFAPGKTGIVNISVQNNNTIDEIDAPAVEVGLSQYYGSASSLTALLEKGNAPITVKTEKVLLGTLSAGMAATQVPFSIEVDENATPGIYQVDVTLTYRTLISTSAQGNGGADFQWSSRTQSKKLDIEIKEESLEFEITNVEARLRPGAREEIKVTFKNIGDEPARDSLAKITANSPLSMTNDTAFLSKLEPGESAVGIFELKVAGDAVCKEYALDTYVKYNDSKGDEYLSEELKVPVTVDAGLPAFGLISKNWVSGLAGVGVGLAIAIIFYQTVGGKRRRTG